MVRYQEVASSTLARGSFLHKYYKWEQSLINMDFKELYLPAPPLETVRVYQLGDITYAITDQQNNLLALAPRGFNLHGGFDGLSNFTNCEEGVHPSAYLGRVEEVNGDETGPIGTEFGKRVFPVKYFEPFSTGDEVCPIHIPSNLL